MITRTHTRTHVFITFANPFLICDECRQPVPSWHNPDRCGCDESGWRNQPCEHKAGVSSACASWGPVDGCQCLEHLGYVPHEPAAPKLAQGGIIRRDQVPQVFVGEQPDGCIVPQEAAACDGLCVTAADIGVGSTDQIAYPHPSCPLHAPGQVCQCGQPDRCLSPTHEPPAEDVTR